MDLFSQFDDPQQPSNILHEDGIAHYYGAVLPWQTASAYFTQLLNDIQWQSDELVMFGKHITTSRQVALYGDKGFDYTYSQVRKTAHIWTPLLLEIKHIIEQKTGEHYNACLLNLYHNGSEGMSWHSDNGSELKECGAIASLSLGAQRKFSFKHKKTQQTVSLELEHGGLLVMKGQTQQHWLHALPKSIRITQPRINLTFRSIVYP